jgi:deoxyribose-phosphate aldolase
MQYTYDQIAGAIDHALLHPTMSDEEMAQGCELASKYEVASVCVKPYFVKRAAEILAKSNVAVGTVIGFPHGSAAPEVKRYEAEIACISGATELDMVVNSGKISSGDWEFVRRDIELVVAQGKSSGALTKVILETDYNQSPKILAELCRVSELAGADFVKTSTGFGFVKGSAGFYSYVGATEKDLALMRSVCSPAVGIKASGGIRDLKTVEICLDLGCTRVGTTSTSAILDEFLRRSRPASANTTRTTEAANLADY